MESETLEVIKKRVEVKGKEDMPLVLCFIMSAPRGRPLTSISWHNFQIFVDEKLNKFE